MTTKSIKKGKGEKRTVRGWAVVSNGGVLIGGGDKTWGYTALCVYSTRVAAQQHKSETRPSDKIVPVTISYTIPAKQVTKRRVKKVYVGTTSYKHTKKGYKFSIKEKRRVK